MSVIRTFTGGLGLFSSQFENTNVSKKPLILVIPVTPSHRQTQAWTRAKSQWSSPIGRYAVISPPLTINRIQYPKSGKCFSSIKVSAVHRLHILDITLEKFVRNKPRLLGTLPRCKCTPPYRTRQYKIANTIPRKQI